VESLSAALGIPIERVAMDKSISGKITNLSDNQFKIIVNSKHSKTRQRFTIAHELGHAVLHNHLIGDGVTDNFAYRAVEATPHPNIGASEETEANKFAANLLMPAEAIIELQNRGLKSKEMAEALGVSQSALEVRQSAGSRRKRELAEIV
jgi:Zn-dependent peptidase ImmA (M78 family)